MKDFQKNISDAKKKKISAAAHTQKSLQSDVAAFFVCVSDAIIINHDL